MHGEQQAAQQVSNTEPAANAVQVQQWHARHAQGKSCSITSSTSVSMQEHMHIRTQHASTHTPDVQKQASPASSLLCTTHRPATFSMRKSKAQHTATSARHRVQAPHARPPPCSARRAGPRLDRTLPLAAHAAPRHRRRCRPAVTLAAQHHRVATPQTTITPPLPATSRRTAPPFTPCRLACLSHHL
jgi:hypothetical protein